MIVEVSFTFLKSEMIASLTFHNISERNKSKIELHIISQNHFFLNKIIHYVK